jgi:hydroxyethylthiazole kinase
MDTNLADKAAHNLQAVRREKPLIHNITNFVVMNFTANALLSAGASPVMAHAPDEVQEMVELAGALVCNIGTLSDEWIKSMELAGARASSLDKPVILDPAGAGATSLRTNSALLLLARCGISVVRGNASEIRAITERIESTRGVESVDTVDNAVEAARRFAEEKQLTVAITGANDYITDGDRRVYVSNGHALMGKVTGTGCVATTLIAAFSAVDRDAFTATTTALSYFGLAGEIAAQAAHAPASFATALIDALYTITPEKLADGARIELSQQ